MGCLAGRFAKRQGDDALSRLSHQRLNARGARLVAKQTFERFLHEALLPAPDAGFGFARSPRDLVRANAIGGQKHDLSPPDVLLRRVTVPDEGFEPTNIGGRNGERFSCAHRADSHLPQETGIPCRTQMSGSIHSGVRQRRIGAPGRHGIRNRIRLTTLRSPNLGDWRIRRPARVDRETSDRNASRARNAY